jgi:hypothetical protein
MMYMTAVPKIIQKEAGGPASKTAKRQYYGISGPKGGAPVDSAAWDNFVFIVTHVTVFELPVVLLLPAAAALHLAGVLTKHNARAREAKLARRVAAAYGGLLAALLAARWFLS